MKQFSFTAKVLSKLAFGAAALALVLSTGSCKKDQQLAPSASAHASTESNRSVQMRSAVTKVLRDFAASTAGGSSVSTSGSGGSGVWASGISYTNYSTPSANVYQWSDPTSGAVFTFSESTGGSGLGQLAYAGKSADFNYVLSIKANAGDPTWSSFFNGRDLRGVVAIDGELTDSDFLLKKIAFFFVATTGGTGTYKFIDFGASTVTAADGLGEIIDLGETATALSTMGTTGKFYITSGGHVNVTDNSFEMQSDAKVMDATTSVDYSLEGAIMFE